MNDCVHFCKNVWWCWDVGLRSRPRNCRGAKPRPSTWRERYSGQCKWPRKVCHYVNDARERMNEPRYSFTKVNLKFSSLRRIFKCMNEPRFYLSLKIESKALLFMMYFEIGIKRRCEFCVWMWVLLFVSVCCVRFKYNVYLFNVRLKMWLWILLYYIGTVIPIQRCLFSLYST